MNEPAFSGDFSSAAVFCATFFEKSGKNKSKSTMIRKVSKNRSNGSFYFSKHGNS
jgi:hypothetical protein